MTVWAVETNTPAVALYESLGFRRVARREVAAGVWSAQFERWHDHLKTSFDADVAGYEAARPGYPDALFDLLGARCGLGAGVRVLELGPGAGQATVPLLDRGATVVAVEPGVAMAARLRERVGGRSCTVVEAEFEHADLDGPFDLAVAATSFHWIDPAISFEKLANLVRPGGWLALWWNVFRDTDADDSAFAEGLSRIVARFQTAQRQASPTYALDAVLRRRDIEAGGWFDLVDEISFHWPYVHDAASLRALFASFSDWSTLPVPDRTRALDDVAALVDRRDDGTITRRYVTKLYVARRL